MGKVIFLFFILIKRKIVEDERIKEKIKKQSYGLDYEFIGKNFGFIPGSNDLDKEEINQNMKRKILEETKKRLKNFRFEKSRKKADGNIINMKKEEIKGVPFMKQIDRTKTSSYMNE